MLFSFSEFQKTKKQLLQEFNAQPPIDCLSFKSDNSLIEYRKILNNLKFQKSNKISKCQSLKRMKHTSHPKSIYNYVTLSTQMTTGTQQNFYLTETVSWENPTNTTLIEEQNNQLYQLIIKITEQTNINKSLLNELRQLEISISFYKQENRTKEMSLCQQTRKHNLMSKLAFKNRNELNAVTFQHNQLRDRMCGTERFFNKSLNSFQASVRKGEINTNEVFDEIAENILVYNKRKQIISTQNKVIQELISYEKDKKEKIKMMRKLVGKTKTLITIGELNKFIRSSGYGKLDRIKKYFPTEGNEGIVDTSTAASQSTLATIQKTNILKMTREIIKVYQKMKSDEDKLKQIYEFKLLENKERVTSLKNLNQLHQDHLGEKNAMSLQSLLDESSRMLVRQSDQRVKIRKICGILQAMQERGRECTKKLLRCLITLAENWLKYDEDAIKFLNGIIEDYINATEQPAQTLSDEDVKMQLSQHFQNWENYLFFCDQINRYPLLLKVVNKQMLITMFRRIIKTKIYHPKLATSDLFVCCLNELFAQGARGQFQAVCKFITMASQICLYASKNQAAIINLLQNPDSFQLVQKTKVGNPYLCDLRTADNNYETCHTIESREPIEQSECVPKTSSCPSDLNCVDIISTYQEELNKVALLNKRLKISGTKRKMGINKFE